jgi:integrase/recombinase XerC
MSAKQEIPNEVSVYLNWLEAERRMASGTVVNYRRELQRLLDLKADKPFDSIDAHQVRRYIAQLHGQGLHARSIAYSLSVWRSFYDWLARKPSTAASHIVTLNNPVRGIRAPKAAKPLPKALNVEQATALAEFAKAKTASDKHADLRDHAMLELLYSSALRRAELVSLDVHYVKSEAYESASWLSLDNAEAHVIGKGSKRRVVPIGRAAMTALYAWLAVRSACLTEQSSEDARAALFLGARGERINAGVVYQSITKLSLLAGVPAKVHPHVLRHSAASHLLQSSQDLRAVQEFLGHANISTTQVYTRLDWQHLAKVYDAAHPRAKKVKST